MTARDTITPILYASKCLGFARCRYNGVAIYDDFIEKLKPHVEYITACPEVDIGLGIPREPVRIVVERGARRLQQPATGRDVTELMETRCAAILDHLPDVDGFFLKSRSPSCGIKDTKYYPTMTRSAALGRGPGFFGQAVLERFPKYPIENEGRIRNFRIREHFLTRIFTSARFRAMEQTMGALVHFHAAHKLLLMAYSQKYLKIAGAVVANRGKSPFREVHAAYRAALFNAMLQPARYNATINVLMHEYGYFRKRLSAPEKKYFLDSIERYRRASIPLNAVITILNAWVIRFGESYLAQQTFFQPYPEALVEITDSGNGRGKNV